MPSRSLDDLRPIFRAKVIPWLRACEDKGLDILVYCTLRSLNEQAALYSLGRDRPGRIVTNARPGQSAHNFGLALDFVPLVLGKPEWKAPSANWTRAVELAGTYGMESASHWKRFKEWPHLELPNWRQEVES